MRFPSDRPDVAMIQRAVAPLLSRVRSQSEENLELVVTSSYISLGGTCWIGFAYCYRCHAITADVTTIGTGITHGTCHVCGYRVPHSYLSYEPDPRGIVAAIFARHHLCLDTLDRGSASLQSNPALMWSLTGRRAAQGLSCRKTGWATSSLSRAEARDRK